MRYLSLAIVLLLMGCSTVTTITDPEGNVYAVDSRNNALVTFENKKAKMTVNNQGKPSTLDDIIKLYSIQQINKEAE